MKIYKQFQLYFSDNLIFDYGLKQKHNLILGTISLQ